MEHRNYLGLDVTPNRQYNSGLGRWLTPDPENAGADPSDPQTWNAYAYVRNNPTTLTDPTGEAYQVCHPMRTGIKPTAAASPMSSSRSLNRRTKTCSLSLEATPATSSIKGTKSEPSSRPVSIYLRLLLT